MNVSPEQWPRVKEVVASALELTGEARAAYVAEACRDDSTLRRHVETLLASSDQARTFLETFPLGAPADVGGENVAGRVAGSYLIEARIGAGGMGEVFRAHDTKLDRPVALKLLTAEVASNPERLRRFRAEARAASSLNHPHILVIHDFGELDARPFIVTELVDGETLRQRLERGPIPVREAIDIATQVASALSAAHARGLVHRDIKPENIMIRRDGYVKVLDFGLAKLMMVDGGDGGKSVVRTQPGVVLGTPRYMSPEQARGRETDPSTDVWSVGVVLYEMLAGRPPFAGSTPADVIAGILASEPEPVPSLARDVPATVAAVVAKALRKPSSERYASAADLHAALVASRATFESSVEVPAQEARDRPTFRVIVLPLRALAASEETEFLAFSLPDAIAGSLAETPWLAVRSPLAFRSRGSDDLDRLIASGSADAVLAGTLGDVKGSTQLRLNLIEMPSGTVLFSMEAPVHLNELFELQARVARGVAKALAPHVQPRSSAAPPAAAPSSPGAYVLYLRANQLAYETSQWTRARDLYEAALQEEPNYAPAWARLGRCHRVIGKFAASPQETLRLFASAEEAFHRALAIDPDLSVAHSLYAQLEVDVGRAPQAVLRLIERVRRFPNAADLFAGLVHALRFCGLVDQSVAAHARARALDPAIPTSVHHTWWMKGAFEKALSETYGDIGYMPGLALASLGRERDAIAALRWRERETGDSRVGPYITSLRALLEGNRDESLRALSQATAFLVDPEATYYLARTYARLGEVELAIATMTRVVEGGFSCHETFARDPWLDSIRPNTRFAQLLTRARETSADAARKFEEAGGPRLLDVTT